MSTIAALATAPVSGGVGILRISGPQALSAALPLAHGLPQEVQARRAHFCEFVDRQGAVLDHGLFLYFQAPHSYTGEDVVELQAHGSVKLMQLLLEQVLQASAVRLAGPGEFTRRAFLNGRMDLAAAEAVADLVAADSEASVRAAGAQVRGELSRRIQAERDRLLALHADLEGVLNFPDEAEGADLDAAARVAECLASLGGLLADAGAGRIIRRGAKVVLFGPPNAGKSTLFNRLVGEQRALVDDEPGTTRDALEARVEWDGLAVRLVDTAGLRENPGRIEALGIERARAELASADLGLLLLPPDDRGSEKVWRAAAPPELPVVAVQTKADLLNGLKGAEGVHGRTLSVSARTGLNVDALRGKILEALWGGRTVQAVTLTSERHAQALRQAVEALERAELGVRTSTLEVVSGEVGLGLAALGEITGENVSDALLDAIFQRFCIGK